MRLPGSVPLLGIFLSAVCLMAMTLRGWANGVLFVGCVLCIAMLALRQWPPAPRETLGAERLVVAVLAAPLASVLLSAFARGDLHPPQFDAPLRFALAIPVFFFALRARLDPSKSLRWILPLALVLVLLARLVEGQPARWPAERATVGFVDPLVFGYLSLTFGLMAMFTLGDNGELRQRPGSVVLALLALGLGAYFSIRSESRTGWLAVPLLVALWVHLHWSRASRWSLAWTMAGACTVAGAAYLVVPTVHDRIAEAVGEVLQYPWSGAIPPDLPVSLRITYLRIAADVIAQHPWFGIGTLSHVRPEAIGAFPYASPVALQAAFENAFHNQVVSNAVRSGVGGLVATLALLLVPLAICVRGLAAPSPVTRRNAAVGVAFFTCFAVSSLTTEVVDLKYMASVYAVMTALLCGSVLAGREEG